MNLYRPIESGTIEVVSGVSTSQVVERFFGGMSKALLSRDVLRRLQQRQVQTADEANLLVFLAATKTHELTRRYHRAWTFRGLTFHTIRADVPMGIFNRLTPAEIFLFTILLIRHHFLSGPGLRRGHGGQSPNYFLSGSLWN